MSRDRLASGFVRATGASYVLGRRLAEQGLIRTGFVVPDAATAAQRQFEARLCFALAGVVRDKQIGGAVLGVTGISPVPNALGVRLHPKMQRHLIQELLPTLDADGSVHGMAGLRCSVAGGRLTLCDASSTAAIVIKSWVGPVRLAPVHDHRSPISGALTAPEADKLRDWLRPDIWSTDSGRRDLLLSRLLRRPCLLNAAGLAHGIADIYSHHHYDLVVDYCCGPAAVALAETLIRSGITGVPHNRPDVGSDDVRVTLGLAQLVLRRRPSCGMSGDLAADYLAALASCTADDFGPDIFIPQLAQHRERRE